MISKNHHALTLALITAFAIGTGAAGELPAGVSWGESMASVSSVLGQHCQSTHAIDVNPPSFPLAAEEECHYLCADLQLASGTVGEAVFVFADDKLVMIEARGGAVDAFSPESENGGYMHYLIFEHGELWHDTDKDTVWFLSDAARHPNLFTFSNPFLGKSADAAAPQYEQSAAIPAILDFDVPLDKAKSRFRSECPLLHGEETRVWLPNEPASQVQANCFGYEYAGFPRKFEAVYGDGQLEVVWILTGKGEESRVRKALIAEFGPAEHINDQWEVFAGFQVALRKDKPEVLLLSEKMVPHYKAELMGQGE